MNLFYECKVGDYMKFSKCNKRSIAEVEFNMNYINSINRRQVLLDSGSQVTTISMSCLFNNTKVSNDLIDRICVTLRNKYSRVCIRTNVSTGVSVYSLLTILHNVKIKAIDGDYVFGDMLVNLILNRGVPYVLLGWEFIFSHAHIYTDRLFKCLDDFDSNMYNTSIQNLNYVDSSEIFSLCSDLL